MSPRPSASITASQTTCPPQRCTRPRPVARGFVPALVAAAVLAPVPGVAAEALPLLDRFNLSTGVFAVDSTLSGRWDAGPAALGTRFDFRRDLGFDGRSRTPFHEVGVGLGQARRLQVEAFGFATSDDGRRVLARSLDIGGDTYAAGADVSATLDTTTRGASASWFLHATPASAAGVGLGVVDYRLRGQVSGEVEVEGDTTRLRSRFDEAAWAPMLRAEYVRRLGARGRLNAAAAYLRADRDDVSGRLFDAHVQLDYFPWPHVGLSLRYRYNVVDLDLERASFNGVLHLRRRGPQLLATLRF